VTNSCPAFVPRPARPRACPSASYPASRFSTFRPTACRRYSRQPPEAEDNRATRSARGSHSRFDRMPEATLAGNCHSSRRYESPTRRTPRRPEETLLYQTVRENLETFLARASSAFLLHCRNPHTRTRHTRRRNRGLQLLAARHGQHDVPRVRLVPAIDHDATTRSPDVYSRRGGEPLRRPSAK
jgi:hypothetical protein